MDTQKYRAFIRSVDLGSFSAAAEEMRFTPSGISHMVSAVENEVGCELLKRGRNGVSLNPSGEIMMPAIRALINAETAIEQESSALTGLAKGSITIGAYSSIAAQWLPQILRNFQDDYPGISVQLMEGVHEELDDWMAADRMDFCLFSYRKGLEFEWIPLRDDQMFLVVSPDHPFASKAKIKPEECEGQPFIMPGRDHDIDVVDLLNKFDVSLDIKYTTIENYSAISMVECGLGVSIMNELITKGRTNHVVMIPFDPPQKINLGIAISSIKTASPAARKMIEYIKNFFSA